MEPGKLNKLDAVSAGDEIPPFVRTTDLANWNRFAAVNDEFIPLHMDAEAARAAGQPDVFGMGNLRLSYLHNLLHAWLAGRGDIVELSCEFRGLNFRKDVLSARGRVIGKERVKSGPVIHLELGVENQRKRGDDARRGDRAALRGRAREVAARSQAAAASREARDRRVSRRAHARLAGRAAPSR